METITVQEIIRRYLNVLILQKEEKAGRYSGNTKASEELIHLWGFVKTTMINYCGDDNNLLSSKLLLDEFNGNMNEKILNIKIDDVHGQWIIESESYLYWDGAIKELVKKSNTEDVENFYKSVHRGKFTSLNGIYSFAEACNLWGLSESTLRKANHEGRFQDGEIRQSGKVWLVTKQAMERLYGERK